MDFQCARDPVVIIGMSRSGTTLLASLLRQMGLFLGSDFAEDLEARYFHQVNRTVLKQVHAYWDNPAPMRYFLLNPSAVQETVDCMARDLLSWRISNYLGIRQYLHYRSLQNFAHPWGWKDPQTAFTLPLWLRLFPRARIIYIVRNGIDVAHSLSIMEKKVIERRRARAQRNFRWLRPRMELVRFGFKGSARSLTLAGGFSLWEEYVCQSEEMLAAIENSRRMIKFEELLADPRRILLDLSEFCGLNRAHQSLDALVQQVRQERSNAFAALPDLNQFYEEVKNSRWMVHYGYARLTV